MHICLSGVTHYQWRNFDDVTTERGTNGIPETSIDNVAPETHNFNLSTMFKANKSGTNFIGVGVAIIDDIVGFTKTTSGLLDLNFKMRDKTGNSELAIGVGVGFQQFGLVNPNFQWRDPNDPNIPTTNGSQGLMNMKAGVWYRQQRLGQFKNFYAGLSTTQLTSGFYNGFIPGSQYSRQFVPHYYATAGADYDLGAALILEPAILVKYGIITSEYRPQVDLQATVLYASTFRGGLSYRQWGTIDALSVMIGYKKDWLELGYSYDITLSKINNVSAGTHEIMVKYCIPIEIKVVPRIHRLSPRFL